MPTPPSQLSKEAHAGFAHVASMLVGQGIMDPAGEQHLTSVIVDFFESRMVSALNMVGILSYSLDAAVEGLPVLAEQGNAIPKKKTKTLCREATRQRRLLPYPAYGKYAKKY